MKKIWRHPWENACSVFDQWIIVINKRKKDENKHKTLIAAAAMQGIMLGFWSAGWLCWVCENVGLSPDFLMLLVTALIFCLIFEIIQILQKLSIACPAAMGILAVSIYINRTKAVSGLNAWLNGFFRCCPQLLSRLIAVVRRGNRGRRE